MLKSTIIAASGKVSLISAAKTCLRHINLIYAENGDNIQCEFYSGDDPVSMFFEISDDYDSYQQPVDVRRGINDTKKALLTHKFEKFSVSIRKSTLWKVEFGSLNLTKKEVNISVDLPRMTAIKISSIEAAFLIYINRDADGKISYTDDIADIKAAEIPLF